jgi:YbbR domain-containing protein
VSRVSFWPFRHVGLKLLSVGLAVLLWMFVSGEATVERGLRVPLELQQMPAELELQGELPALVDVRVRGGSDTLSRMAAGDIVAVIDVHTARPGQRLFQLTPEQVRAPFGVQVLQVGPSSVAMVFERTATKQVPVVPSVEGTPAPGFVVGTVTSDPQTVEVTGPETAVASATEATTEPVSVAGAREAVNDRVTVGFLDPTLRLKDPRPASVHIEIVTPAARGERGRGRGRVGNKE